MTVAALPVRAPAIQAWPYHLGALAMVAALLLAVFAADVGTLLHLWWTSTTFGHCLFIGPVIGWLVWQRRAELARLTPFAWWPGLALMAIGGSGWLLGAAGSVAFARQLGLVMMLQGAVVTLLGPQVARGLLFPLCYAFFLVPFGAELEPPLQTLTVSMVVPLLRLVGLPAEVDGVLIHAGRYYFEVAEACSGAKFVIAMGAFAVLVANLCFLSWRRRIGFMIAALVVPVIANGVRAWGTIWAADRWGLEAATGFDHIVYGWVFFGLVMAGLLALGWRWFDRSPDDPAFDPGRLSAVPCTSVPLTAAAAAVIALAALFPAWNAVAAQRAPALPATLTLPPITGWTRAPLDMKAPWQPYYPGADHYLFGRYTNGHDVVDMGVAVFAGQGEGRELASYGTGVLREEDRWVRVADLAPIGGGTVMRITAPGPVERVVATWYRIGDVMTADERRVKLETMRASLTGGDQTAVALHLSTTGRDPEAMGRFLAAAGTPDLVIARIIGRR